MAEPKPIASLSSGLLARKGAARPAMRRQGMDAMSPMGSMMLPQRTEGDFIAQDDLGWNDMGYDVDPAHDEHVPDYGNLLAGAIPDALPAQEPAVDTSPEIAAPVVPDVVRQQAEIAERLAAAEPEEMIEPALPDVAPETDAYLDADQATDPQPELPSVLSVRKRKVAAPVSVPVSIPVAEAIAAVPAGRRAAFTLRLDSDRHLKLRLASAVTGQSAQALVTAALDELLTKIPEIEDLAGRVPRPAGR
ncbi:hypothetical protein [Blastomonas aquatica]|uniref:Flagellar hook-length control protein-like C-terminal domain-containing protein n=1 Tax=Blastomonas aquatica TaxID=1510276 RepID=A0ABQ1J759_9SPHN|nr:hypothetical protein [Blastomonas aquatica]GGB59632.1 hypothetical protein GCM10010833_13090 [Blastomonas aquatica]